jgi:hypothetical protein
MECEFICCLSIEYGGGVRISGSGEVWVMGCIFEFCVSLIGRGRGIFISCSGMYAERVWILGCVFKDNDKICIEDGRRDVYEEKLILSEDCEGGECLSCMVAVEKDRKSDWNINKFRKELRIEFDKSEYIGRIDILSEGNRDYEKEIGKDGDLDDENTVFWSGGCENG